MEQVKDEDILGKAYDDVRDYVNLRLELLKIETAEKSAKVTAYMISSLVLLFTGFFCLLFISIVAGIYFSAYWGDYFKGFGVVGAFYVVLFLMVLLFKKAMIHRPVINTIIRLFFSADETN